MRKQLCFALPTTRPYGGYKRGRLPSFAPGTPPLSPNPRNHCRASSFPPTTLQIRDRLCRAARTFPSLANLRPSAKPRTLIRWTAEPHHPQVFLQIRDFFNRPRLYKPACLTAPPLPLEQHVVIHINGRPIICLETAKWLPRKNAGGIRSRCARGSVKTLCSGGRGCEKFIFSPCSCALRM